MRIEPLSATNIREAATLATHVFPGEFPSPRLSFWASLYVPNHLLKIVGYRDVRYWVAIADEHRKEVLGTVGLYSSREDRYEARWLGWFYVTPERTRQGVGSALLNHAIAEAQRECTRLLRVETWDGAEAAVAQTLYKSRGFKTIKVLKTRAGYSKIYMELLLQG